jgi:hypothetical protein
MTVICHLRTAVTALALLSIEATAEEPLRLPDFLRPAACRRI